MKTSELERYPTKMRTLHINITLDPNGVLLDHLGCSGKGFSDLKKYFGLKWT